MTAAVAFVTLLLLLVFCQAFRTRASTISMVTCVMVVVVVIVMVIIVDVTVV